MSASPARFDLLLEPGLGEVDRVQLQLAGGDIGSDDPRPEPSEFHRESARTGAGLQTRSPAWTNSFR